MAIARALMMEPQVLLFDELYRGARPGNHCPDRQHHPRAG
ncbi:hypothetical protein ACHWUR_20835 [Klebsiella pneumoniae]